MAYSNSTNPCIGPLRITRRLEFDAGHRIPDHAHQCRHLHGHRYVLEITLEGNIQDQAGKSDHGMVMDFSLVKTLAQEHVTKHWDHAFLVWKEDRAVVDFLATLPDHRTVLFNAPPTAENLAAEAFTLLAPAYAHVYGNRVRLLCVRIYETPHCWAEYWASH